MKTELEKFSDQMALMEMCVQLEDEQKKIFDALPKLKDEFSKEAKVEFARLTKQAEAIEWKLAEARGEYLKTVEANRAEFARMEQSIKAKGTELAEYSKRLQSEVPPPVEQKIKAIFETLPRPANGKDGVNGKDASLLTGFRGNWDADTTYKAGDWFTFRGSSYLVLRACKGQIPTKNAQGEPNAYYAVFAMSGAPGIVPVGVYLPTSGGTITGNLHIGTDVDPFATVGSRLLVGRSGASNALTLAVYGAATYSNSVRGYAAGGTESIPVATPTSSALLNIAGSGHSGAAWVEGTKVAIILGSSETWSTTAQGTNIAFYTTRIGTTTLVQHARFDDVGRMDIGVTAKSMPAWGVSGALLLVRNTTITDTTSSGAVAAAVGSTFQAPALAASNATVFADAATLYLPGAPTEGANVTITRPHTLWIDNGSFRLDGTDGAGVALGTLATAPSAGNPDKWIPINSDGTQYWIPAWAA